MCSIRVHPRMPKQADLERRQFEGHVEQLENLF